MSDPENYEAELYCPSSGGDSDSDLEAKLNANTRKLARSLGKIIREAKQNNTDDCAESVIIRNKRNFCALTVDPHRATLKIVIGDKTLSLDNIKIVVRRCTTALLTTQSSTNEEWCEYLIPTSGVLQAVFGLTGKQVNKLRENSNDYLFTNCENKIGGIGAEKYVALEAMATYLACSERI